MMGWLLSLAANPEEKKMFEEKRERFATLLSTALRAMHEMDR